MQVCVRWVEELTFIGKSAPGHQILMNGNPGNKVPSPMEIVLMAMDGYNAINVVSILQKGRHKMTNCEMELTSEHRGGAPYLFMYISPHFIVAGKTLKDVAVSWTVGPSAEKYCPVALALGKAVKIIHSCEVIEA